MTKVILEGEIREVKIALKLKPGCVLDGVEKVSEGKEKR
jgi:hypothetical protein